MSIHHHLRYFYFDIYEESRLYSHRFYGVVVSTADFESADPGSNPGRTLFFEQLRLFAR